MIKSLHPHSRYGDKSSEDGIWLSMCVCVVNGGGGGGRGGIIETVARTILLPYGDAFVTVRLHKQGDPLVFCRGRLQQQQHHQAHFQRSHFKWLPLPSPANITVFAVYKWVNYLP